MGANPIHRLLFLLGLGMVMFSGQAASDEELPGYLKSIGYSRTDLKRVRNSRTALVYTEVKLNGRRQRWLVDTGWSITALDPSAARSLKTLEQLKVRLNDPILGEVHGSNYVMIEQMSVGGIELQKQPAQIEELDHVIERASQDGMFGMDLLRRHHAIIEFSGGGLYLRAEAPPAKTSAALHQALRESGWTEIPVKPTLSVCFAVDSQIQGRPVRWLVDSGAMFTTLDISVARELGLKLDHSPQVFAVGVGKRSSDFYSTTLAELPLGSLTMKKAGIAVHDLSPWHTPGATHFDGLLGSEILTLGDGVLDCSANKLFLKDIPPGK